MPSKKEDLPGTLERSPKKVQRTYEKALDSAHDTYDGDEERAHRAAWGAVKHVAEKRGDHWEEKDEYGPSDEPGNTHGGVDRRGSTRQELYERAQELGVEGRSKMDKGELADAIARKQD